MYARAAFGQLAIADGPSVTTPASLTDATPLPAQEAPAYLFNAGGRLYVTAEGRFTSTGTPGTGTFGLYLAKPGIAVASAVLLVASSALVPLASQTTKTFRIEWEVQILSAGAGGAALGQARAAGVIEGFTAAGSTDLIPLTVPMAAVSIDTTSSQRVLVGYTPSVTTGTVILHSVFSEYSGL